MPSSITFRISDEDRVLLDAAAAAADLGISVYARQLAEAEARRLRVAASQAESIRITEAIAADPELLAEVERLTSDGEDWPEWTGPLPG